MSPSPATLSDRSRLAVLLEQFSTVDDPRDVRRITHPLAEICSLWCAAPSPTATITTTSPPGASAPGFLRRHLAYRNGVPGGRWLTILMNRINPALFAATAPK